MHVLWLAWDLHRTIRQLVLHANITWSQYLPIELSEKDVYGKKARKHDWGSENLFESQGVVAVIWWRSLPPISPVQSFCLIFYKLYHNTPLMKMDYWELLPSFDEDLCLQYHLCKASVFFYKLSRQHTYDENGLLDLRVQKFDDPWL